MKKVIIHIGLGKTGTTSIQSYMGARRGEYHSRGFYYPSLYCANNAHHALVSVAEADFSPIYKARFDELLDSFERTGLSTMIISSEIFCYAQEAFVGGVRQALRDYNVNVIFYARGVRDFFVSSYMQFFKQQRFSDTPVDFLINNYNSFDIHARLKWWDAAFGRQCLTVRLYDSRAISDVVQDFVRAADIPPLENVERFRENESISPLFGLMLAAVGKSSLSLLEYETVVELATKASRYSIGLSENEIIGLEVSSLLRDLTGENNKKFADTYLTESERILFLDNLA